MGAVRDHRSKSSMPVTWLSGDRGDSAKELHTRSRDEKRLLDATAEWVNHFDRKTWRQELSDRAISSRSNREKVAGLKSPFCVSEELQCYGGDESGLTSESERPSYRSVDDEEEDYASGHRQEPHQDIDHVHRQKRQRTT